MPRTLTATLTAAKNQVVSTDPWVWLFEVDSSDFPAPVRFVSDIQAVTYQGNTFDPFPADVSSISENTVGERQRVRGIIANVDQQVISLLENYWSAVSNPDWTVTIWQVLRSDPDEVPITDGEVFEVLHVETDLVQSIFELEQAGIPSKSRSTGRRFTATGGFSNLPRI